MLQQFLATALNTFISTCKLFGAVTIFILMAAPFSFSAQNKNKAFLYFANNDCSRINESTHPVTSDLKKIDLIVKTFLKGPGESEDYIEAEPEVKLLPFFIGSKVKNGVVTLKFKAGAGKYLGGTACEQTVTRMALEETLKHIKGIKSVKFEIAGKLITEWDA